MCSALGGGGDNGEANGGRGELLRLSLLVAQSPNEKAIVLSLFWRGLLAWDAERLVVRTKTVSRIQ